MRIGLRLGHFGGPLPFHHGGQAVNDDVEETADRQAEYREDVESASLFPRGKGGASLSMSRTCIGKPQRYMSPPSIPRNRLPEP